VITRFARGDRVIGDDLSIFSSPYHPMTQHPSPVAVIGAGVIGAAVAQRLAEKGVAVVLLDRAEPGSGTTAASYAWVNANEKLPRAYFDLSVAAMEDYRRLAWRLAPAPGTTATATSSGFGIPPEPPRCGRMCNGSKRGATRRSCCRRGSS
jgi:glycine/D-amino acid oxidase-like deaminating enzyme